MVEEAAHEAAKEISEKAEEMREKERREESAILNRLARDVFSGDLRLHGELRN
jgi:hypothetical protein